MAEAAAVIEPMARGLAEDSTGAATYLEEVAARIASSWACSVKTRIVVSASTGRSITDFAASNGNDLIALATHGRGGALRMILGSIADTVVRTSPVPTLLSPATFSDEAWEPRPGASASAVQR